MDPFTISMAVAPLILSSAKLTMLISAVKDSYKNAPATLIATSTECKVMHMTLSKMQGLVYKNESDLSSRLTAQKPLREAFDDALTGCRMTLAALNFEMDKLVEPKKGTQPMDFGFRPKARLVWKEAIMKQLLDQSRGQMTSLQYLIQFLESEAQADILKSLQKNLADIRRIFHRAKSIRSDQGLEDDQSSFTFTHQSAALGLTPSYEAQLSQSSTYQRAQTAAAEELLARKIELMDEKYALEDRVERLLLESDMKDLTVRQLEGDIWMMEHDVMHGQKIIRAQTAALEELSARKIMLEHEISKKDQRISMVEHFSHYACCLHLNAKQEIFELEDDFKHIGVITLLADDIIHQAALNGNAKAMGILLSQGADIEATDEEKRTPLHIAACHGHVETVKMLLEEGANKEAANNIGWTPLIVAANKGHVEIVKTLLEKGANEEPTKDGWTPLFLAVIQDRVEVVHVLLENGANKEAVDKNGLTPLIFAAFGACVDIVQMLLEKGANIEAVDKNGWTPLIIAACGERVEVVRMLLGKGANKEAVDKNGWTPLIFAAYWSYGGVVQVLLAEGANKEAVTDCGLTPLKIAHSNSDQKVVELLLSYGARK